MIIRNNTNKAVELKYYVRSNPALPQSLVLVPKGFSEVSLRDGIVLAPQELQEQIRLGNVSISDEAPVVSAPVIECKCVNETPVVTSVVEESPEVNEPDTADEDAEENNSEFICEVCGREFASYRGLRTHMKSHE